MSVELSAQIKRHGTLARPGDDAEAVMHMADDGPSL